MSLTDRQAEILRWIRQYVATHGFPPTRREIASGFGFASQNAAEQHIQAIAAKGAIRIVPGISRGILLDDRPAPPPAQLPKKHGRGRRRILVALPAVKPPPERSLDYDAAKEWLRQHPYRPSKRTRR